MIRRLLELHNLVRASALHLLVSEYLHACGSCLPNAATNLRAWTATIDRGHINATPCVLTFMTTEHSLLVDKINIDMVGAWPLKALI